MPQMFESPSLNGVLICLPASGGSLSTRPTGVLKSPNLTKSSFNFPGDWQLFLNDMATGRWLMAVACSPIAGLMVVGSSLRENVATEAISFLIVTADLFLFIQLFFLWLFLIMNFTLLHFLARPRKRSKRRAADHFLNGSKMYGRSGACLPAGRQAELVSLNYILFFGFKKPKLPTTL
ncbi:hypothetical protein [Candidatus Oleimmundimicrobium sp.]|uniref:hypothetical protein n=1 Tax=Candidatus Oleimmundimicrobium sp. TaxID=3060597 RepID=UPI002715691D|nr:hypothetical protein [Candidatus Oleimmundimicrobium sp.]MDO8886574.1 hypothetical protein [Candidatus Oleimmundimicrobium sp.]